MDEKCGNRGNSRYGNLCLIMSCNNLATHNNLIGSKVGLAGDSMVVVVRVV